MFVLRAFAGPFIICSGLLFYGLPQKFLIAYSGLAISFGIYYTLKPLVTILFKKNNFTTIPLNITINGNRLRIQHDNLASDIDLDNLLRIYKRDSYYIFALSKKIRTALPFDLLTAEQMEEIEKRRKK